MSLCGPAVASGSTARPPGAKKCTPFMTGSPREEKRVDSSLKKEFTLRNVSALATNDRWANADEQKCYAILIKALKEDA